MNRSHLAAYLVMAAAVGFLCGDLWERCRAAPRPVAPPPAAPASVENKTSAPAPTDAEALKARGDKAVAEEKWADAVDAIERLAALGDAGMPDAFDVLMDVLTCDQPDDYAIREAALWPLADDVALQKYCVVHARERDSIAADLALQLCFRLLGEAKEGKFLFDRLATATDVDVAMMLRSLEGAVTAEMLPQLADRARAAKGPALRLQYVRTIASAGVPAAEKTLAALKSGPDADLAEGAGIALQMLKPPVSGFLVLNLQFRVKENGERPDRAVQNPDLWRGPIRRGDIITQIGDRRIDSEKAMKEVLNRGVRGASVDVQLFRNGEATKVTVAFGPFVPKGKYVEAAK